MASLIREFFPPRNTHRQMCICNGYWDATPHSVECIAHYADYLNECDYEDRTTFLLSLVGAAAIVVAIYILVCFAYAIGA